ncbi:DEAD/DEAH box helicase [Metabacillus arenae]|uniref:DEAD/DEAH box helicase n=1 Tax=Metabacillus arenae TaxID=2771434 RepID=A0A926NE41_9BACI|nr:DEAD/DEAH box helicase [Metabacillus arenae]MBD1379556.1 DEAD/DEAH box helicase [Metabacillus arenae]
MTDMINEMKPFLAAAWKKAGFEAQTEVQQKVLPFILEGKDVIAEAPTGTGKTLAYVIPVLNQINFDLKGIQAVILASSHELVMQIHRLIQEWSLESDITSAAFIGGANVKRQIDKLKKHPQIVIGTPGRILELIKQKKMKMHQVKTIVLDEGDQLLVPEHIKTIEAIIKSTLNDRQLLFFSATLPKQAEATVKSFMKQPELVTVTERETGAKVEHVYVISDIRDKADALAKISRLPQIKAMAFINDISQLKLLAQKLEYNGAKVAELHSDLNKDKRKNDMKKFRTGELPLLLATDVAARGLDIQGITHVVHIDFSEDPKQYIHRSGRTGRLGSTEGTVLSIVTPREERKLKQLCRELNINLKKKVLYKGELMEGNRK